MDLTLLMFLAIAMMEIGWRMLDSRTVIVNNLGGLITLLGLMGSGLIVTGCIMLLLFMVEGNN